MNTKTVQTPNHCVNLTISTLSSLGLLVGPWPDRRKAAIALLQLITRLDKNDLAFCDVKGENIGFIETGEAVLLDVDTLFTKAELGEILSVRQYFHFHSVSPALVGFMLHYTCI